MVAGGLRRIKPKGLLLKDEAIKIGVIGILWESKCVIIAGSCEATTLNIAIAYQKTEKGNSIIANGKNNTYLSLYHDGNNIYLKNTHNQAINIDLVAMTNDTLESIGIINDISKWTKIEVTV